MLRTVFRVRAAVHKARLPAEKDEDRPGDRFPFALCQIQPCVLRHFLQHCAEIGLAARLKAVFLRDLLHHAAKLRKILDSTAPHCHAVADGMVNITARAAVILRRKRLRRQAGQVEYISHARLKKGEIRRGVDREPLLFHRFGKGIILRRNARIDAQEIRAEALCQRPCRGDKLAKRRRVAVGKDRPAGAVKQAGVQMVYFMAQQSHCSGDPARHVAAQDAVPAPVALHTPPERGLHKLAILLRAHKLVQLLRVRRVNIFRHSILLPSFDEKRITQLCITNQSELYPICIKFYCAGTASALTASLSTSHSFCGMPVNASMPKSL